MLSIKFKNGKRVRAIVLEEPIHKALSGNGVSGVVECAVCDCRAGLFKIKPSHIADEIERFANDHDCGAPTKEELLMKIKAITDGR